MCRGLDKTTLYVVSQVTNWDPSKRDQSDLEGKSIIEWLPPETLTPIMQKQGALFKRADADESEIIKRALPYIKKSLESFAH